MRHSESMIKAKGHVELFTQSCEVDDPKMKMLIVHGLLEHSGRWEHVARFFNEKGISVYAFDLRGHGRSGGRNHDVERWSDFHDDLQLVIENLILPSSVPWALYAHSVGGLIALGYLLDKSRPQPEVAIVTSPALETATNPLLRALAPIIGRIAPTMALKAPVREGGLSHDREVERRYFSDPLVNVRVTARMGWLLGAEEKRLRALTGQIDIPMWVHHGSEDPVIPTRASEGLAMSPKAQRKVYDGMRHECHNEVGKEQVFEEIYAWLTATVQSQLVLPVSGGRGS